MRNEKGQIRPWINNDNTMTFFFPASSATPWNRWNCFSSSNSGQVASTGRSRAARQQARLLYAVAVSIVSLGSPKAWNFVAKIPNFPSLRIFQDTTGTYPQTPKQKFMFRNSFLFGCEKGMPGVQGYVGVLLDTACSNNNRGHGPTKCLFPDGSSTPRHGGLSNCFWIIFQRL